MSERQLSLRSRITAALYEYTNESAAKIDYVEDPNTEGAIAVQALYRFPGEHTDPAGRPANVISHFMLYHGIPGMKGPYNGFEIEEVEFTSWPPVARSQEDRRKERNAKRRDALDKNARDVYDHDRDFPGEFSDEA